MSDTYIAIMQQSLKKKISVLTEIARINDIQKEQLTNPECSVEEFDKTVEDKAKLIEQLEQLDSGFEKLYSQVAEELADHMDAHAEAIRQMQDAIHKITDKSVMIQAQEARNKDLMQQKFHAVRRNAREVRANSKAITGYHRTMNPTSYLDPQFIERKQ